MQAVTTDDLLENRSKLGDNKVPGLNGILNWALNLAVKSTPNVLAVLSQKG